MKRSVLSSLLGVVAASAACTTTPEPTASLDTPKAVEARLRTTLEALAAFGEKRAGTPEGIQAGAYVAKRFEQIGLEQVRFEAFTFPSFDLKSSSLTVLVEGKELTMQHETFAYSGTGKVDAALVDLGFGYPADYEGKDVTGKVVLVERDSKFHRSSQYRLVVEHGGVAMLYISTSPDNLIQVGTVAEPEDGIGSVPAITIGADDGAAIVSALASAKNVTAKIEVEATVSAASGRNVVGELPGDSNEAPYLVLGAHYDTWMTGSADNSTGVATLLETARAMAASTNRRHRLVFVAYDGEELGLFGGYDFLRKHVVVGKEPMLGFINFEMPGAGPSGLRALAHTNGSPIDEALRAAELHGLYNLYVGMELVPAMFGGVIPTDIQGMYWGGLQGMSTACDSVYYHTPEDTIDKLDLVFLSEVAIAFGQSLTKLDESAPDSFAVHDTELWKLEVSTEQVADGLKVDLLAIDANGTPQPNASVRASLVVDDFTRAHLEETQCDETGKTQLTIPAAALSQGNSGRWLHLMAGKTYPLVEQIVALP